MLKTLQFTTVICHQFIHRNIWDLRPPAIFTFGQFWPFGLRSACDILWRNQWDSWSCAQRPTKLSNSQLVGSIPPPSEKYEFVSWDDDYSQYVESHKSHVPNHQPDKRFTHKGLLCFLFKTHVFTSHIFEACTCSSRSEKAWCTVRQNFVQDWGWFVWQKCGGGKFLEKIWEESSEQWFFFGGGVGLGLHSGKHTKKLWKITILFMGKATISTGPWLQ